MTGAVPQAPIPTPGPSVSESYFTATAHSTRRLFLGAFLLVAVTELILFVSVTSSTVLVYRGNAMIRDRRPAAALRPLETARRLAPRNRAAWRALSIAYAAAERRADARQVAGRAFERFGEDTFVFEALGAHLTKALLPDEAIAVLEEATQRNPKSAGAWYLLAKVYRAADRSDDEREALVSLEAILIDMDDLLTPGFAIRALEEEYYSGAEILLKGLLAKHGHNKVLLNNLAWLYATAKDPAYRRPREALVLALRAVKAGGHGDAYILDTLAEAYFVNGRFTDALITNAAAIRIARSDRRQQSHLDTYLKSQQRYSLAQDKRRLLRRGEPVPLPERQSAPLPQSDLPQV